MPVPEAGVVRRLVEGAIDQALHANECSDPCIEGLFEEWRGDSYLLCRSAEAADQYGSASRAYEQCSEEAQFSWGMEEEFDYGLWAVRRFLESRGFEAREALLPTDFDARIRAKQEFAEQVVEE